MPLILRVDVDKPYGKSGLFKRVISKLREDYWFPKINSLGYLSHLTELITYCNRENIQGSFYFRLCTVPNELIISLLEQGRHRMGFHAENTRTMSTFAQELNLFKEKVKEFPIRDFTKHGSGYYKLGKNHYPSYEPEKYREWADAIGIKYTFGNGIAENRDAFCTQKKAFYADMFWIEPEYRHASFSSIEKVVELAQDHIVPILIHPSNYYSMNVVRDDFHKLVTLSKEKSVNWLST